MREFPVGIGRRLRLSDSRFPKEGLKHMTLSIADTGNKQRAFKHKWLICNTGDYFTKENHLA